MDKVLPKPWFCKPIFGHSAGSTNWTGPIANSSEIVARQQFSKTFRISRSFSSKHALEGHWEYLNHRGTKIRVFRVCFRPLFLPPFFPRFSPLFPLQALFTLPPLLPSSPPRLSPLFLTHGKLRFRYPSDLFPDHFPESMHRLPIWIAQATSGVFHDICRAHATAEGGAVENTVSIEPCIGPRKSK